MRSAVDFLPSLSRTLTSRVTSLLLYLGSGRTSLFSDSLLLAILICSDCIYLGRLAPYLDRPCLRLPTPAQSRAPLRRLYLTPARSLTLPPLINTIESCWRL